MRQKEREVMRKKYCLYVSVRERLRYLHGKKERVRDNEKEILRRKSVCER